eukprot:9881326-Alexandrium_andersonii.AAC.1
MCWQHAFDILIHGGPGFFWWHLAGMAGQNCIEVDSGVMAWYSFGSCVRRVHETSQFALEGHVLSSIRWM